jgi:hypothetical protein
MNETKRRTLADFEAAIELPEKSFFVKNDNNIRFVYKMFGEKKYWTLPSRLAVAQFLKTQGVIKFYSVMKDSVEMYTKTFVTTSGENGVPEMTEMPVKLKWEDLDFTAYEVVRFVAEHEWEKVVGKVIKGSFKVYKSIRNAI